MASLKSCSTSTAPRRPVITTAKKSDRHGTYISDTDPKSSRHGTTFRSVLPHEPPPSLPPTRCTENDEHKHPPRGYVLLQGCLFPRPLPKKNVREKKPENVEEDEGAVRFIRDGMRGEEDGAVAASNDENTVGLAGDIEKKLFEFFRGEKSDPSLSFPSQAAAAFDTNMHQNLCVSPPHSLSLLSVWVDPSTLTRARLSYRTWHEASDVCVFCKTYVLTPQKLFATASTAVGDRANKNCEEGGGDAGSYSTKPLQISHVTNVPPLDACWPYGSPPKFRRLLLTRPLEELTGNGTEAELRKGVTVDAEALIIAEQKCTTRYVYLSGLGEAYTELLRYLSEARIRSRCDLDISYVSSCLMIRAIRSMILKRSCFPPLPVCSTPTAASLDTDGEGDFITAADSTEEEWAGQSSVVEVWLPQWNKKNRLCTDAFVGMKCHQDASSIIRRLCGVKATLEFRIPHWLLFAGDEGLNEINHFHEGNGAIITAKTSQLFLDYADVTRRCYRDQSKKKQSVDSNCPKVEEQPRGPSRPECTSATADIQVPGLVIVPDFVSKLEEEVLMASLTGPHAPWAPHQMRPSGTGAVQRRVQHYGYVFDYSTADVLRNRDMGNAKADCPPMPAVPKLQSRLHREGEETKRETGRSCSRNVGEGSVVVSNERIRPANAAVISTSKSDLEGFINSAVSDLRGWDALAGIVERTRRYHFPACMTEARGDETQDPRQSVNKENLIYPFINQMTVNEYQPGQGIGSHVDSLTAFGDGLISLTLNGGCVMEFRERLGGENGCTRTNPKTNELNSLSNEKDVNTFPHAPLNNELILPSLQRATNETERHRRRRRKLVYLRPRSLLLMSGPARFHWEHMIVGRQTDMVDGKVLARKLRISLTLRTALQENPSASGLPANSVNMAQGDQYHPLPLPRVESCTYPPKWGSGSLKNSDQSSGNFGFAGSRTSSSSLISFPLLTPYCEKYHVHDVYDAIADQWHHTRGRRGVLWPGATTFLTGLPSGSIVADVGCGDGKYFAAGHVAGCYVIGTDVCEPLLRTAMGGTDGGKDPLQVLYDNSGASVRPAVAVADCMNSPLRDGSCDAAICIALMHHVSTVERRLQCLKELRRVVKVGGRVMIQAWALEQEEGSRHKFAGTDVFVPFMAQPRYLHKVHRDANHNSKVAAVTRGTGNDGAEVTTDMDCTYTDRGENEVKDVARMYSDAYEGAEYDENKGLVVFKRYCHLYRKGELDLLLDQIDGIKIIESGYESGNHYIIAEVVDD